MRTPLRKKVKLKLSRMGDHAGTIAVVNWASVSRPKLEKPTNVPALKRCFRYGLRDVGVADGMNFRNPVAEG
jgi:hypothetical protein